MKNLGFKGRGWTLLVVASLGLAIGVGCGGGSGAAGGSRAPVNFYVTDDLRTGTDAVWGTIFSVSLVADDSSTTSVFEDTAGKVYNFRALNSGGQNLFSFLVKGSVPTDKTFTGVQVVMKDSLSVLETGDDLTTTYDVQGAAAGANKVRVNYNFPAARTFSSGDSLAVDFDLGAFVVAGGNVTPSLRDGNRTGIDDNGRHNSDEITGTVSSLSGTNPNFQFTLTGVFGTVNVSTTSGTVFFNSDNSANPILGNGKRVEVEGILNASTGVYNAYKVKIKIGNGLEDPHEAKGQDSNLNAEAGTLNLEVFESEGFAPTDRDIIVATSGSTVYRANNGASMTKDEFFAALKNNSKLQVEAEGTYTSVNTTLTATKLKIEDEDDDHNTPNDADLRGLGTNLNVDAGTLTISSAQCEGFVCPSSNVNVSTTGGTEYKDINNENVSKSAWFSAVAALAPNARTIKAEGTWNGTVFTARELKIRPL